MSLEYDGYYIQCFDYYKSLNDIIDISNPVVFRTIYRRTKMFGEKEITPSSQRWLKETEINCGEGTVWRCWQQGTQDKETINYQVPVYLHYKSLQNISLTPLPSLLSISLLLPHLKISVTMKGMCHLHNFWVYLHAWYVCMCRCSCVCMWINRHALSRIFFFFETGSFTGP